jgi:translation initiation factor 1A
MVKNRTGGSKTKGQARKFVNAPKQTNNLRVSQDEYEVYAQVTKMLGNGMCHVLCIDNKTRLCHIRGKFRGRGKRDNFISNNNMVLVGLREWEMSKDVGDKLNSKLQNCDLLEVYSQIDVDRLKNTINEDWNIFNTLDKFDKNEDDDFDYIDEKKSEYMELIEKEVNTKLNNDAAAAANITSINEEEINIDDI